MESVAFFEKKLSLTPQEFNEVKYPKTPKPRIQKFGLIKFKFIWSPIFAINGRARSFGLKK
jgi:hypothetical protein